MANIKDLPPESIFQIAKLVILSLTDHADALQIKRYKAVTTVTLTDQWDNICRPL